jgi:hypothetical protein
VNIKPHAEYVNPLKTEATERRDRGREYRKRERYKM